MDFLYGAACLLALLVLAATPEAKRQDGAADPDAANGLHKPSV